MARRAAVEKACANRNFFPEKLSQMPSLPLLTAACPAPAQKVGTGTSELPTLCEASSTRRPRLLTESRGDLASAASRTRTFPRVGEIWRRRQKGNG